MRILALATDYDGTLAEQGRVDGPTIAGLERFRASGRVLILVTGRELAELLAVFPRIDLFDRVVAENGAHLYRPADRSERLLADRPPDSFVETLKARGVAPISVGRVVVATWVPHDATASAVIRESGLDLDVILNKRAVMILPTGVNKATGLNHALGELGINDRDVAGVGDAENDQAFLAACGLSAAVSNALPTLKERADFVTNAGHGAGVVELIDAILAGAFEGRPTAG